MKGMSVFLNIYGKEGVNRPNAQYTLATIPGAPSFIDIMERAAARDTLGVDAR